MTLACGSPGLLVLDLPDQLLAGLDDGMVELGIGRHGYDGRPARQPGLQGGSLPRTAAVLDPDFQLYLLGTPPGQVPFQAGQQVQHVRALGFGETSAQTKTVSQNLR